MTIREMVRSLRNNVFLPLVVLCMVGGFPAVSFADEPTMDKAATETPAAGTDDRAPAGKVERAGQAAGSGVERAGRATGRGLTRAANATERGVRRAGRATGRGISKGGRGVQKGGKAVEKTFSGKDSANEQPKQ
ncbi:MAG: hypothetical protein AB9866_29885 [Syntrophobacteraceae bacterium]